MLRIVNSLSAYFNISIYSRSHQNKTSYTIINPNCYFFKGILFYFEFNLRLLIHLLKIDYDVVYCVDTDTLLAVGLAKKIKKFKSVYDSHEYFLFVPELSGKWLKRYIWDTVEMLFIKSMDICITVNDSLSYVFNTRFGKKFYPIKNVPYLYNEKEETEKNNIIFYQGALNHGRGLIECVEAMQFIEGFIFEIAGDGDIRKQIEMKIDQLGLHKKVKLLGKLSPDQLKEKTIKVKLGLNLIDNKSTSYFLSLANKFFDYMHANVPSLNMNFPEYNSILNDYKVGKVISNISPTEIVAAINEMLIKENYDLMVTETHRAKLIFNWEVEEKKLILAFKESGLVST
jgi:glycosyltransferase involved in cell wall biosynthesis